MGGHDCPGRSDRGKEGTLRPKKKKKGKGIFGRKKKKGGREKKNVLWPKRSLIPQPVF